MGGLNYNHGFDYNEHGRFHHDVNKGIYLDDLCSVYDIYCSQHYDVAGEFLRLVQFAREIVDLLEIVVVNEQIFHRMLLGAQASRACFLFAVNRYSACRRQ
jgi:uncharacterized protein Usg